MGTVYLAIDPTLERDVALKVLPPDFATDAERIDRFRREARALAATLMFWERDYEGARQGLSRLRFPLRPSATWMGPSNIDGNRGARLVAVRCRRVTSASQGSSSSLRGGFQSSAPARGPAIRGGASSCAAEETRSD